MQCDLQAPACANCRRRAEPCDFQYLHLDGSSLLPASASESPSSSSCSPAPAPAPPASPSSPPSPPAGTECVRLPVDLALGMSEEMDPGPLRQALAQQAQSHRFLHDSFSALAVLHAAHAASADPTAAAAAYGHQIDASVRFRRTSPAITEHSWFAILLFALSVLVFQLNAMARFTAAPPGLDADRAYIETVLVLRSAAALGMQLAPYLVQSRLIQSLRRRAEARVDGGGEPAPAGAASALRQAVQDLPDVVTRAVQDGVFAGQDPDAQACYHAVVELQGWLHRVAPRPRTWLHLVWWPGAVSPAYVDLLARRHPVALVVLVHWCAVVQRMPSKWFFNGWAERAAASAVQHLDATSPWHEATRWAREELGLGGG
ncbi:hypothetical protein SPI_02849 [Niveomyces insectorum RCEF 264]|uniref:C6 zinc finger domain containing protein n=1 Tax=Niveomyces insectorum RCEF 264 TaxID=1081102 RepID=A0A162J5Z8_9HYPO|nr:hypothetical protein SPI_02849 [Niveomyces insectorum RCEF 264]